MDIILKITEFKNDLLKEKLSYEQVFQKHVIQGDNYFFSQHLKSNQKEFKVKERIAQALGVHLHEVTIVGSSKLGYSLNPKNLFNPFDDKFKKTRVNKDKSDIDIAVISPELFDKVSKSLFNYTDSFKNKWSNNEYYFGKKAEEFNVPICYKYFEYFSKGWFRPDMKPQGFDFCQTESYEELNNYLFSTLKGVVA